ncbi:porin family protein [Flavobacterium sp. SM2513]|uniref:porin family protein n=1 Tax=Flavobacterium sp. SM2513 TaxID=3424766 RepID=UPI003D7FE8AA
MKKIFLVAAVLFLGVSASNAQDLKFGAKIGSNFSTLDGDGVNGDNLTSFHVGALVELNLIQNFSLQSELMYSSQGTELNNEDYKLDYVSLPVLAKFYVITDKLSLEAGPQFSFLINEDVPDAFRTKTFDFAAVGGLGYNLTSFIFVQARYVVGLTDTSKDASVTNKVIQLSAGLRF